MVGDSFIMLPHPNDRSLEQWTRMLWNRRQRLARLKAPDVLIAREGALIQEALEGMARARNR